MARNKCKEQFSNTMQLVGGVQKIQNAVLHTRYTHTSRWAGDFGMEEKILLRCWAPEATTQHNGYLGQIIPESSAIKTWLTMFLAPPPKGLCMSTCGPSRMRTAQRYRAAKYCSFKSSQNILACHQTLGGAAAVQFLGRSSVNTGMLRQIWAMCTAGPTITKDHFFSVLRLICMFQNGDFPITRGWLLLCRLCTWSAKCWIFAEQMAKSANEDFPPPVFSGVSMPPPPQVTAGTVSPASAAPSICTVRTNRLRHVVPCRFRRAPSWPPAARCLRHGP